MKIFKVIKPGIFMTVQDAGRYGYLKYGVPVSGAMDMYSFFAANSLTGNDLNAACLETTLIGPELEGVSRTCIAVTGGNCSPKINGRSIPMWRTVNLEQGDVLSFGKMESGCRAYISVRGGIDVPEVLESKSTYVRGGFGGLDGRQLKTGDVIEANSELPSDILYSFPEELVPDYKKDVLVHVVLGPQAEMFTEQGTETFLSNPYRVTAEADRMGYRLDGPAIKHATKADIVSDALLPGAVQVPRDGKPIVIMRDAQTTGGYPKIAAVVTPDVDLLGQAKTSSAISFSKVGLSDAQQQAIQYRMKINSLKSMMLRV